MRVLLAGEYSRLHNSLKEGLARLGVEARIVATGDGFKQYPADYPVRPRRLTSPLWKPLRYGWHRLTRRDIASLETAWRLSRLMKTLADFDVVQFINPYPFETPLPVEKRIVRRLIDQNRKAFLLACGDDSHSIRFYLEKRMRYSILTPMLENPGLKKQYRYSLKYLRPEFQRWQAELERAVTGIIPTDLDYAIPYAGHPRALPMIPNPVNTDRIPYRFPPLDGPVVIFHGINSGNYLKKGNAYFAHALQRIRRRYGSRVRILEYTDLPYRRYMELLAGAHIVLDQVFAYDQGYNALESMAMGKVVFTGAEKEFYAHYKLTDPVNINALPDTDDLTEKLAALIEAPERLRRISENARAFVEREHHYVDIARRYISAWEG